MFSVWSRKHSIFSCFHTQGTSAFCFWTLSTHCLTYFVLHHKTLMTSVIEVARHHLGFKSRSAAARNPVASVERLCALSELLCMKLILWRLSIRPNNDIRLDSIYKSLPTVTVIAGPNLVHCICGWCASKTHKPAHIPERVSTLSSQNRNVRNISFLS